MANTYPAASVFLFCPAGKAVFGGGQNMRGAIGVTLDGYPFGAPTTALVVSMGWAAHAYPISNTLPTSGYVGQTLSAYVICGVPNLSN